MDLNNIKIPRHVAIILDGNGRWAKEKGLPRSKGHDAGFKNMVSLSKYILSCGVEVLSLYCFSCENFKRSKEEVEHLMNIFTKLFKSKTKEFNKNNIKVVFSGRDEPLSKEVIEGRNYMMESTKNNTGGILNICLNYSSRAEIIDAAKKIVDAGINSNDIDEELFSSYLYQNLPDVDLMIRTSGELRLSNFLLWQNSYAEFYFPKTYFPDFDEKEFDKALIEYTKRDRRFGGINYNIDNKDNGDDKNE